jgi:hypothetical protein
LKKKEFNCVILESKTTIEKEADEQDENSLPKSKRMKREEEDDTDENESNNDEEEEEEEEEEEDEPTPEKKPIRKTKEIKKNSGRSICNKRNKL